MATCELTPVINPYFHNFHPEFMAQLVDELNGEHWVSVKIDRFMDNSPYSKVGGEVRGSAVVPVWLTDEVEEFSMRIMELGNALRHQEPGYAPLTPDIIYVIPYIEGRADKITQVRPDVPLDEYDVRQVLNSHGDHRWIMGETVYAELFAEMLAGPARASKVVLLEPHSALVHRYLAARIPQVLTLTAIPLFAQWLETEDLVDQNTVVAAPDLGALSRAGHLAELLGVPLVLCDKWRPRHNRVQVVLKYGDVRGKRVIGVDEVIDTAGTIVEGGQVLTCEGAAEVIVLSTTAKLSGPAVSRLDNALRYGVINRVVVTDSLPTAYKGRLLESEGFEILPVAQLLASGVKTILDPQATLDTYGLRPYLFRDETPLEAYQRLQPKFNLPQL